MTIVTSEHKKVPHRNAELFSLRRLDVSFDSLKKIKGTKHTQNRTSHGKNLSVSSSPTYEVSCRARNEEVSLRLL